MKVSFVQTSIMDKMLYTNAQADRLPQARKQKIRTR